MTASASMTCPEADRSTIFLLPLLSGGVLLVLPEVLALLVLLVLPHSSCANRQPKVMSRPSASCSATAL